MKPNKTWHTPFAQLAKLGLVLLAIGAVLYMTAGADSSPAMLCIFAGSVLTAVGGGVTAILAEGELWNKKDEEDENERG